MMAGCGMVFPSPFQCAQSIYSTLPSRPPLPKGVPRSDFVEKWNPESFVIIVSSTNRGDDEKTDLVIVSSRDLKQEGSSDSRCQTECSDHRSGSSTNRGDDDEKTDLVIVSSRCH